MLIKTVLESYRIFSILSNPSLVNIKPRKKNRGGGRLLRFESKYPLPSLSIVSLKKKRCLKLRKYGNFNSLLVAYGQLVNAGKDMIQSHDTSSTYISLFSRSGASQKIHQTIRNATSMMKCKQTKQKKYLFVCFKNLFKRNSTLSAELSR